MEYTECTCTQRVLVNSKVEGVGSGEWGQAGTGESPVLLGASYCVSWPTYDY